MITQLPFWISLLFIAITILAIALFYFSNGKPKVLTSIIVLWSIGHSLLAYAGFYQNMDATPPRFALVLLPTTIIILYSIMPNQRERFVNSRNTVVSTLLHVVRLPVEIVLLHLFLHGMIPELMTFEGRNFDILAGITAPIMAYLFIKKIVGNKTLLVWNVIATVLIFLILINGLLSAELPFQQFAFDQPNRAVAYFPFILLPATVVPLVIWTHIIDIIKLKRSLVS